MLLQLCFSALLLLCCAGSPETGRLPVVFVYTVVPNVCKKGLPQYIRVSLEQAVLTQQKSDVIIASNFKECKVVEDMVNSVSGIGKWDTSLYKSERSIQFLNVSENMFVIDGNSELWMTSALRFFYLEDMMLYNNYTELFHVEADNLLYGSIASLLSTLRSSYQGLAATPLTEKGAFITASVFWISHVNHLIKFNDFLLELGSNTNKQWDNYIEWMRPHAGKTAANGNMFIKPFAINEMSMLAYYHAQYPHELKLLPVVPNYKKYLVSKHIGNISEWSPDGRFVGGPTGQGIWDPNSWGQFIGGTSKGGGKNKQFTDPTHIAGQAMRTTSCRPSIECANSSLSSTYHSDIKTTGSSFRTFGTEMKCYTAIFVRCDEDQEWTLLWNLHVHSKQTENFRSVPCPCPGSITGGGDNQGE